MIGKSNHEGTIAACGTPQERLVTKYWFYCAPRPRVYWFRNPKIATDYPDWTLSGTCDTANLIKAGSPSQSLVAGALVEEYEGSFGVSGCTPSLSIHKANKSVPSKEAQDALVKWITDGAAK